MELGQVQDQVKHVQCKNCGAQLSFDPKRQVVRCDFCGSQYITEVPAPAATADANSTETSIVTVTIEEAKANSIFSTWISQGFWQPSDLKTQFRKNGLSMLYIPFWYFEVGAQSQWSGQYSETRYRRVTRTRTVQNSNGDSVSEPYEVDEPYKVWFPRNGTHSDEYQQLIVGCQDLKQEEIDRLLAANRANLNASNFKPFTSDYLLGWNAATPSIDKGAAHQSCDVRVRELEKEACAQLIERLDSVSSQLDWGRSFMVYFPIWICPYTYKGAPYRGIIHGETGEIIGTKPISMVKVTIAVVLGLIILGIILAIVMASRH